MHRDTSGQAAIDRALKHGLYKLAAYLKTGGSQLPLTYRSEEDGKKIDELEVKINTLVRNLKKNPAKLIQKDDPTDAISKEMFRDVLSNLFNNPLIAPLMQVAKLASLNCHRLSGRTKFQPNADNYDGDRDYQETITTGREFVIRISRESNVSDIYSGQSRYRVGANGLYLHETSRICVATCLNQGVFSQERFAGLITHELTHFVAYEVFNNRCLPYIATDTANESLFADIVSKVRGQNVSCSNARVKEIIGMGLTYDTHQELIVRIPQLIAEGHSPEFLRTQFPELMGYYEGTFLPAVGTYAGKLQNRALDGWQTWCKS